MFMMIKHSSSILTSINNKREQTYLLKEFVSDIHTWHGTSSWITKNPFSSPIFPSFRVYQTQLNHSVRDPLKILSHNSFPLRILRIWTEMKPFRFLANLCQWNYSIFLGGFSDPFPKTTACAKSEKSPKKYQFFPVYISSFIIASKLWKFYFCAGVWSF